MIEDFLRLSFVFKLRMRTRVLTFISLPIRVISIVCDFITHFEKLRDMNIVEKLREIHLSVSGGFESSYVI